MKLFNNLIFEANDNVISIEQLNNFVNAIMKSVPKEIKPLYNYLITYKILSKQDMEDILNGSSGTLKKIELKYGISEDELKDIKKIIKKYCKSLKMLPMFLTDEQIQDVINGNKVYDDIALDFESEKGKNEIATKFMPLVNKWVNKYVNKSALTRSDLYSAALDGLSNAINDYWMSGNKRTSNDNIEDKEGEKKASRMTFKNYASFIIQQYILREINQNSRDIRLPQSQYNKMKDADDQTGSFNTIPLSIMTNFSDEWSLGEGPSDSEEDKFAPLGTSKNDAFKPNAEKAFNNLYNIIKNNFSERDCSVFFKTFGLNGYKKQKGFEIAKEFNMTPANATIIVKRIIAFLKKDKKSKEILSDLMDIYTESLLISFIGKSKEYITEALIHDDLYILLEEVNRFNDKKYLSTLLKNTLKDYDKATTTFIMNCLEQGFEYLDANYKQNKKILIHFLERMFPTEVFKNKSDAYCLEKMNEIINYYNN